MSSVPAIGFIGTGVMGSSMARRLLAAGHPLHVTTRTRERAAPLIADGAHWVDAPRDLAACCEIAISMVGFPADVEEVYLGARGLLASADGAHPLRIAIDMTTSAPALAERIAKAASARGIRALDAPVSGGDVGAREGTLSIMIGGDAGASAEARPVLAKLGSKIVHHGPPGSGQHAKLVNQLLIATNIVGVCEGLLYAERAGLDPLRVLESVGSGAAGSWSVQNLAPRMIKGDFEPGFKIVHFLKDLGIALEEANRMGLSLRGLSLARELYDEARAQGFEQRGTQALLLALRRSNRSK
ncbi:MAG: NAD(P)-dependent oxidoreductase [Planctomycetes bacterium]|nr:NAD(P)-dependent oxidoreductase [Planctomycetota bacterium]